MAANRGGSSPFIKKENYGVFDDTSPGLSPSYITLSPGLSPSALFDLDPPLMLPNDEAQLSPTTGTFYSAPNHENLKDRLNVSSDGMEICSEENNLMADDVYKEFEYPKECLESGRDETMMDNSKANIEYEQQKAKDATKNSDDGFYWRKYGQKHVKGSEYPRSYYKCTSTKCPVTKKVERSHEGHVAEIVYKGSHNHPQPKPVPQPSLQDAGSLSVHSHDASFSDFPDPPAAFSDNACFNEELDDAEFETARKRKRDIESAAATRSTGREGNKVVVQLESEVDILEDGYRWRKYGQKVVKGNPNPRSYYKCTAPNCTVRKHVERAADDIKSVITTYDGKHTHAVPSSRTGVSTEGVASPSPKPAVKQVAQQDLPLYLDRKPMPFDYASLGGGDLGFGGPSPYTFNFPSFHSVPYASVVPMKPNYSNLYPEYMPMPMHMPMPVATPVSMPMSMSSSTVSISSSTLSSTLSHTPSYNYGGDATHQLRGDAAHQLQPKEEMQGEIYHSCLTITKGGAAG